jgi:hypothetical protein
LRSILYRSPVRTIAVDGKVSRLVPGTAPDGLLMHVPRAADYPAPFRLSPDARTIAIDDEEHSRRRITVEFDAYPIAS